MLLPAKSGLSRFLANAMSRAASSVSGNPRQLYLIRGYPAVLHKTQPYRQAALPAAIWRPAPKVSVILDEVDQRVDNGLLFESVEIEISDASDDAVEQLQWELANELLPFAGTDSFSLTLNFITRLSLTPEHVCSFDFQRVVSFKPRVRNDGIRDLRFMSLTKVPPRTTTWSQHTKSTRRDRQGPDCEAIAPAGEACRRDQSDVYCAQQESFACAIDWRAPKLDEPAGSRRGERL